MKTNRVFGMVLGLVIVMGVGVSPLAFADVVVTATPQPPPAQPAPVVVQPAVPVMAQPVQPVQPVIGEPAHRSVVRADVSSPHSYMGTIAGSALLGGVAGVLIGGSIYYLGNQTHPAYIGYWAAGGVLVGTGVGLMQIIVQESRVSQAMAMQSDPAPTLRLALYQTRF